jgi:putative pyrroloquinoline-quinone binding quinoprotein
VHSRALLEDRDERIDLLGELLADPDAQRALQLSWVRLGRIRASHPSARRSRLNTSRGSVSAPRDGGMANLLIYVERGIVRAVERDSGRIVWHIRLDSEEIPTVAVHRERIVVAAGGRVFCIDYSTGQGLWKKDGPWGATRGDGVSTVRPVLLVDGEQIFVTGTQSTVCYTLDGGLLWVAPLGCASPCLAVPGAAAHGDLH